MPPCLITMQVDWNRLDLIQKTIDQLDKNIRDLCESSSQEKNMPVFWFILRNLKKFPRKTRDDVSHVFEWVCVGIKNECVNWEANEWVWVINELIKCINYIYNCYENYAKLVFLNSDVCVWNFTWFERVSMIVIVLNCVTLGMYRPCEDNDEAGCTSFRCRTLALIDDLIFGFFAIEMV